MRGKHFCIQNAKQENAHPNVYWYEESFMILDVPCSKLLAHSIDCPSLSKLWSARRKRFLHYHCNILKYLHKSLMAGREAACNTLQWGVKELFVARTVKNMSQRVSVQACVFSAAQKSYVFHSKAFQWLDFVPHLHLLIWLSLK